MRNRTVLFEIIKAFLIMKVESSLVKFGRPDSFSVLEPALGVLGVELPRTEFPWKNVVNYECSEQFSEFEILVFVFGRSPATMSSILFKLATHVLIRIMV